MNANTTTTEAGSESGAEAGGEPGPSTGEQPEPAPGAGDPVIDVLWAAPAAADVDVEWVATRLAEAIAHVKRPIHRLAVQVVDDRRMTRMHLDHAGIDGTTDVLTFDAGAGEAVDADIAICVDEARRQASDGRRAIEHELLLYALHGVLHCAGFDDRTAADFSAMHAEEDRILDCIGVGRIFTGALPGHDGARSGECRDAECDP